MTGNTLTAEAIKAFPSKIGALPDSTELAWDADNPEHQPNNPGVIIFLADYIREGMCACRCSRNLRTAEKWIASQGGKIVASYPVHDRDGQGRKLGRYIKKCVSNEIGNATTFYFRFNSAVQGFVKEMNTQRTHDFKSVRQALKALVRKAIFDVAQKTGRSVISVKDIIAITFPQVDGLSISTYLGWLKDEGLIRYDARFGDPLNCKIKLLR